MSDTISRQVAVDAVNKIVPINTEYDCILLDILDVRYVLKELPSAGPEIIRCRDCKHHDGIRCFRWNSTIITGFDDYCSNAERRGEEE